MQQPYTIILAPNPSIMTGPGTNTIVLGDGVEGATVIDPAIDDVAYLDAILREGAERGAIRRILITHGHPDHIGGINALRKRLGTHLVHVFAFNRKGTPDIDEEVPDGTIFPAGDDTLRAIHTPGHRFDHLSFYLEKARVLFAGDLISGITTSVIAPPEGDMLDYLNSLKRLQELDIAEIVPGHGPTIRDPQAKVAEYIAHRRLREQQVMEALEDLPRGTKIPEIVKLVYTDVDPKLHSIAAWSVEAHLIKLEREGLAERVDNGWALVEPTA
ncbi:MAG TPA: MBL fold metallo-hydrolase [Ktedonobacteraceae bacterium]|nr:MBL fold metallo-hydrolase [Ktedonobacteraceae bacterium]